MSTSLSIDPGVKDTGFALFEGGRLVDCGVLSFKGRTDDFNEVIAFYQSELADMRDMASLILCERMQFRFGNERANPQRIIDLNLLAGALGRDIWVKPQEWKGSVPKDVHNRRVLSKLPDSEVAHLMACAPRSKVHNAIDAVGIYMWWRRVCRKK
jgi:hypothetical protein